MARNLPWTPSTPVADQRRSRPVPPSQAGTPALGSEEKGPAPLQVRWDRIAAIIVAVALNVVGWAVIVHTAGQAVGLWQ